jgi:hypothetical protein
MAIEDSVMYDMSVWSVPMAYNLDAYYSSTVPSVSTTPLEEVPVRRSGVVNASAAYAFVIDWEQLHAPKALAKLWEKGYNVRSAGKEFTKGALSFSRGSLIVLAGRNYEMRSQLSDDMREIAREAGVVIHGFNTGRMDSGMDLASRSSNVLHPPKTALIVDRPFNSYTAGQIWFQFDQNVEFGISRLRSWRLSSLDLNEYDVLILPGFYGGSAPLGESEMDILKEWVQAGGTLVATEGSAFALTKDRTEFTSVEMVKNDEDTTENTTDPAAFTPYEARTDSSGLRRIPGAAFHSNIDISNPLAFGLKEQIYSLTYSTDQLKPSSSYQVVGYYNDSAAELLASGYASQQNLEKAAGNVFAAVAPMGRGNVVMLTDNTQYRMFWRGSERLLINAVMLLGAM